MEKPSLANAVAGYLWPKDFKKFKSETCYRGDVKGVETIITWTVGHAMTSLEPGEYNQEWEDFRKYPVIPDAWRKKVSADKKKQMSFNKEELK